MTEQRSPTPDETTLTLAEMTRAAGVSVRTVRYYIAEGLLPPPLGAGRGSVYTRGHLDRLRLIANLKTAYLPLKEIRQRLAGLDDVQVRRLLATGTAATPATPSPGGAGFEWHHLAGAGEAAHADRHGREEPWQSPPMMMAASAHVSPPGPEPPPEPEPPSLLMGVATPLTPSGPADGESDAWRRVRLSDDAELLIRDTAYRRRRDLVDWLIRWARKVFG